MIPPGHQIVPFVLAPIVLLVYRLIIISTLNPSIASIFNTIILFLLPFVIMWSMFALAKNALHAKPHDPPHYPTARATWRFFYLLAVSISLSIAGFIFFAVPGFIVLKHIHLAPFVLIKRPSLSVFEAIERASGLANWGMLLQTLGIFFASMSVALLGGATMLFVLLGFSVDGVLSSLSQPTAFHDSLFLIAVSIGLSLFSLVYAIFWGQKKLEIKNEM